MYVDPQYVRVFLCYVTSTPRRVNMNEFLYYINVRLETLIFWESVYCTTWKDADYIMGVKSFYDCI